MYKFVWFKPSTWFNSDERKYYDESNKQEKIEQGRIVEQKVKDFVSSPEQTPNRPFRSVRFISGNIVIVMRDGVILEKEGDKEDVIKIMTFITEKEVIDFFTNEEVVKMERLESNHIELETAIEEKQVRDNLEILRENPDFEIDSNSQVSLKGVNLAMPSSVSGSFIEILERLKLAVKQEDTQEVGELLGKYQALKSFWLKLALNPLRQSRLDLLNFVKQNDVRLTGNGNLILYRRIVSKKEKVDKDLISAITLNYTKVKKNKKSPKNYELILKEGNYTSVKAQEDYDSATISIGNLYDLYSNLASMEQNSYTSSHDNNVSIKLGAIYSIPDKQIDLNNGNCSSGGLHAASVNYDYSGFGDTPVVVLVSPSKAITVPLRDTGKMRTAEMFIACINDKPHGTHFDEGSLDIFDEEYNNYSIEALEDAIKDKSFDRLEIKNNKPSVKLIDLPEIVNQLRGRIAEVV